MKTVITYGTFDLFHIGHLRLLERAKKLADGGRLIVGVSREPEIMNADLCALVWLAKHQLNHLEWLHDFDTRA